MNFELPNKIWLKKSKSQRVKESRIFVTEPGVNSLNVDGVAYYKAEAVDALYAKMKGYMVDGMRETGSSEEEIIIAKEMFDKEYTL